jgi:peptidoglycan/xylan/chitin deacetylase (PgdA/CDA1 family)
VLQRSGYRFIDANELIRFLHGQSGLPRRALLLTFDDCYEDLLSVALPILEERGIAAVAFAVSGCLGGANHWDKAFGAPPLQLIDAEGLRELEQRGVEIGAHSRTHRRLIRIPAGEVFEEIFGSLTDLEDCGLKRPRLFAYPYGEHDEAIRQNAEKAGLEAAFTVEPGCLRSGQDLYRIPRIEILRGDVGWRLRWKVATAKRPQIALQATRSAFPKLWQRFNSLLLKCRTVVSGSSPKANQ